MELRQYLEILRRHKWFIIEAVVVVSVVAGITSAIRTPQYRGTATVLLKQNDPNEVLNPSTAGRPASDPDRYASAQKDIVGSEAVAKEALKTLNGVSLKGIQEIVSVAQSGTSDVLAISATSSDPTLARDVANAVAQGYIENRRQVAVAGLQRAVDDIQTKLGPLQARIAELDGQVAAAPGGTAQRQSPSQIDGPQAGTSQVARGVQDDSQATTSEALKATRYAAAVQYETLYGRQQELLVDMSLKQGSSELISLAKTPTAPVSPQPKRDVALGAFVGLLLGTGIVFLREQLDDRVRSSEEVERLMGLPILAHLPYDEEAAAHPEKLAAVERPLGPLSEAARSLRTSIQCLAVVKPIKTILVTSATPGEGKSLVAANLAAVYAQADYRTVLISADLRRPGLNRIFEVPPDTPGLTGAIAGLSTDGLRASNGHADVYVPATLLKTSLAKLWLLPPGPTPPNPAELLGSRRMTTLLEKLAETADVVIIDSPPLLPVTDAAVLAPQTDGVVLVTALDETTHRAAQRAKGVVETTGARLLGVVANKAAKSNRSYGYYDGYYGALDENSVANGRRKPGRAPWASRKASRVGKSEETVVSSSETGR